MRCLPESPQATVCCVGNPYRPVRAEQEWTGLTNEWRFDDVDAFGILSRQEHGMGLACEYKKLSHIQQNNQTSIYALNT